MCLCVHLRPWWEGRDEKCGGKWEKGWSISHNKAEESFQVCHKRANNFKTETYYSVVDTGGKRAV